MKASDSVAAQLLRNAMAASATKAYLKELPPAAGPIAESLAKRKPTIENLNAEQEKARAALKTATAALLKELKAGSVERQKLIRYAEATFGPRAPEILEFRSKVDAKV